MRTAATILAFTLALLSAAGAFAQGIVRASNQPLAAATLNAAISVDLMEQQSVAGFYISGLTASGATLVIEGSTDAKNINDSTKAWIALDALPVVCPSTPITSVTTDQGFRVDTAALTNVRVRVSSIGTGTISVGYEAIPGATLTASSCAAPAKVTQSYVSTGASQMALAIGTNTTLTVPGGSTLAEICVETANVRYRDDGTAATSSLGIPVSSGTCFAYSGPLTAMSFTAQSGSPTIDVSYYKAQ